MKTCYKCRASLPLNEFYKHEAMDDGHLGKCKECTKADVRRNRWEKIEYYRAYDRERSKQPHVMARIARTTKNWERKYPNRKAAHTAVNNAVRDGRLKKPLHCQVCGRVARLHGHHHDYDKPLDVIWSCRPCHYQLDIERRKHEC